MRSKARRSEDGVALIMVILVLSALLIIGTPFVLSMRTHEKSTRKIEAQVRARLLAEAAANHAIRRCMESHDFVERRSAQDPLDPRDQDYDFFGEFQLETADLVEFRGVNTVISGRDSRGTMLEATITDEQGKIHLNSAPTHLLGNLLGVTELSEDLEQDALEMIVPSRDTDRAQFFSDGDPATLDGYLRVGTELIAYRHYVPGKFSGLMRGFLLSAPTPESRFHPAGTIVQDGRGQKISLHKMWHTPGQWVPYETVSSVRQIADWTLLAYVQEKLLTWGIKQEDLEKYGVKYLQELRELGMDPARLATIELEKSDEDKEAEKALKDAGLDPEVVARMGGTGRVRQIAQWIDRIPEDRREQALSGMKARAEEMESYLKEIESYHEDYLPKAFEDLFIFMSEADDIETIPPSEMEEIRPYLTTSSARQRDWTSPQYNRNRLEFQPDLRANYNTTSVSLHNLVTDPFGIGTLLRITDLSGQTEYRVGVDPEELLTQRWANRFRRRRGRVYVWPQIEGTHEIGELRIEAQYPHAVNVNTAERRVLRALLAGIRGRPTVFPRPEGIEADLVTLAEAEEITERILETPLRSHADLLGLLDQAVEEEIITEQDQNVIMKNAINPCDPTLDVSTLPFCYRSHDVYTIDAEAIVNSEAGGEVARYRLREVVHVAPPEKLEWTVDAQTEFTTRIRTTPTFGNPADDAGDAYLQTDVFDDSGDRAIRFLGKNSNKVVSFPTPIYGSDWVFGDPSHDPQVGSLRLQTGMSNDAGSFGRGQFQISVQGGGGGGRGMMSAFFGASGGYYQSFSNTVEGHSLEDGSVWAPAFADMDRGVPKDYDVSNLPEFLDNGTEMTGPGYLSMWIRPAAGAGPVHLYDMVGEDETLNRMELILDGNELTFRIADAARDAEEGAWMGLPMGRRHAEVRGVLPNLQANTWYHMAASWRSPKPGEQSIFVDGRSVGFATLTTNLAEALPENYAYQTFDGVPWQNRFVDIYVDDNSDQLGFPETGVIVVGDEAMEYYQKIPGGFRVRVRGYYNSQTREVYWIRALYGTSHQAHEIGATVSIYGYTNYARYDMKRGAAPGGGSGTLAQPLPQETPWLQVASFEGNSAMQATISVEQTGANRITDWPEYGYLTARQMGGGVRPPPGGGPGGTPGGTPGGGRRGNLEPSLQGAQENLVTELMYFKRSGLVFQCWRNAEGWNVSPAEFGEFDRIYLSSIELSPPNIDTRSYLPTGVNEAYVQIWQNPATIVPDPTTSVVREDFPRPRCEWIYVERPGAGPNAAYITQAGVPGTVLIMPYGGRKMPYKYGSGTVANFARSTSVNASRGIGRSDRMQHFVGDPVHPVYEMRRRDIGQRDYVTVIDNQPRSEKKEKWVEMAHTYWEVYADIPADNPEHWTGRWWSHVAFGPGPDQAFTDPPLPQDYLVSAGARIAKWPSDELPTTRNNRISTFCEEQSTGIRMMGLVDEILVRNADAQIHTYDKDLRRYDRVALGENIDSVRTDMMLTTVNPNAVRNLLRNGGIIEIDDEMIGVREATGMGSNGVQLTGCVRGVLGTRPEAHAALNTVTVQTFPASTVLNSVDLENDRLTVRSTNGFPVEGYVALDRGPAQPLDIWAYYQASRGNRMQLCVDKRGEPVFLGGMFGTTPSEPGPNEFLVSFPFRYFDRYAPAVDSPDSAYYEVSRKIPGAIWRRIRWDGTTPPGTEIVILARVDGLPDWSAPPNQETGGHVLYRFNDPEGPNRIDRQGDQMEVRVHFAYKEGAFQRQIGGQSNEWKDTPTLRSFTVEYHSPTQIRHREEVTF